MKPQQAIARDGLQPCENGNVPEIPVRGFSIGRTRTKRTPIPRKEDEEDPEDVRRDPGKPDRLRNSRKLKTE
jgi:hypothetical protein